MLSLSHLKRFTENNAAIMGKQMLAAIEYIHKLHLGATSTWELRRNGGVSCVQENQGKLSIVM